MAVTASPYGKFTLNLGTGQFNLPSDTLKVMLVTSSYTPNIDTHEFKSDVTNEVSSTGYTAGGATLTTVSWTYDSTNHRAVMGADAVTWTGVTFTARRAVVYKSTGTSSTSRLIGYVDFGIDKTFTAEDFQLSFPNGVTRIRVV